MYRKFQLLYLPFLLLYVTCLLLTFAIHFVFFLNDFDTPEYWFRYVVPGCIPILPGTLLFLKFLKLFRFRLFSDRAEVTYVMIPIMAISAGCILFQNYLLNFMGNVVRLENVQQIDSKPQERFYIIDDLKLNNFQVGSCYSSQVRGKSGSDLKLTLSMVCAAYGYANEAPLISIRAIPEKADTSSDDSAGSSDTVWDYDKVFGESDVIRDISMPYPKAFICTAYDTTISNRLTNDETDQLRTAFYRKSRIEFNRLLTKKYTYFTHLGNNDERSLFQVATERMKFESRKKVEPVMLIPSTFAFKNRAQTSFRLFLYVFFIGNLSWLLMILIPRIKPETQENQE